MSWFLAPTPPPLPLPAPRRPSDAEFSAMAAQAYPQLLDRETGLPWYVAAIDRQAAEIVALKKRIAEMEKKP